MSGLKVNAELRKAAQLVSLHVKNIGSVAGDTVPQVYMKAPESKADGAQFAPKTLVAFDRITLGAGEERDVTLQDRPSCLPVLVDRNEDVGETGRKANYPCRKILIAKPSPHCGGKVTVRSSKAGRKLMVTNESLARPSCAKAILRRASLPSF